ncbi:MAG: winged helix-turn-helix transcriptional regulator, partial [Deltaproteobacteria bacterium]|nr:winged helix-turn-helix transcriptional regulator [Deltaproteobacteria bacterium]
MATRNKSQKIRRYIIEKVDEHSKHITSITAAEFGISRQAANRHIRILVGEGLLSASGKTRSMEYSLTPLIDKHMGMNIVSGLSEDTVWRQMVKPEIANLAENVLAICNHGVTEMMNNVIDHSEGSQA